MRGARTHATLLAGSVLLLLLATACGGAPPPRPTPPPDDDPQPEVQVIDPLAVEGCEAQPDGTMTRDGVQTCIHAQLVGVRACYIQALIRDRTIKGKVSITIAVAPAGGMAEVSAATTGFQDATFDACVVERVETWRFPRLAACSG